ncbi:MAG: DUF2313 domain-containing protein [Gammaproteobacteria bacterium]|nr:DUF2313 domain-containing protein [Gammaproteobacteria bacterium]
MSKYKDKLTALLPPVAYDVNAPSLGLEMAFDASALDAVYDNAARVVDVLNPSKSGALLTDYERVYGIDVVDKTFGERVQAVIAKINSTGGLSIPYFIDLAGAAGLTITIDEPQPFRAGINRAGEPLWPADAIYLWRVNILSGDISSIRFRAGISSAGEKLLQFTNNQIFSLFEELKPAHTNVVFIKK